MTRGRWLRGGGSRPAPKERREMDRTPPRTSARSRHAEGMRAAGGFSPILFAALRLVAVYRGAAQGLAPPSPSQILPPRSSFAAWWARVWTMMVECKVEHHTLVSPIESDPETEETHKTRRTGASASSTIAPHTARQPRWRAADALHLTAAHAGRANATLPDHQPRGCRYAAHREAWRRRRARRDGRWRRSSETRWAASLTIRGKKTALGTGTHAIPRRVEYPPVHRLLVGGEPSGAKIIRAGTYTRSGHPAARCTVHVVSSVSTTPNASRRRAGGASTMSEAGRMNARDGETERGCRGHKPSEAERLRAGRRSYRGAERTSGHGARDLPRLRIPGGQRARLYSQSFPPLIVACAKQPQEPDAETPQGDDALCFTLPTIASLVDPAAWHARSRQRGCGGVRGGDARLRRDARQLQQERATASGIRVCGTGRGRGDGEAGANDAGSGEDARPTHGSSSPIPARTQLGAGYGCADSCEQRTARKSDARRRKTMARKARRGVRLDAARSSGRRSGVQAGMEQSRQRRSQWEHGDSDEYRRSGLHAAINQSRQEQSEWDRVACRPRPTTGRTRSRGRDIMDGERTVRAASSAKKAAARECRRRTARVCRKSLDSGAWDGAEGAGDDVAGGKRRGGWKTTQGACMPSTATTQSSTARTRRVVGRNDGALNATHVGVDGGACALPVENDASGGHIRGCFQRKREGFGRRLGAERGVHGRPRARCCGVESIRRDSEGPERGLVHDDYVRERLRWKEGRMSTRMRLALLPLHTIANAPCHAVIAPHLTQPRTSGIQWVDFAQVIRGGGGRDDLGPPVLLAEELTVQG
ncbi:hypothetical protein DFH06DRAFT_1139699 [Mycena polygramma]|nr:hypothetical protein DFH06DRAFT_1139699 [Mycena polygramma]